MPKMGKTKANTKLGSPTRKSTRKSAKQAVANVNKNDKQTPYQRATRSTSSKTKSADRTDNKSPPRLSRKKKNTLENQLPIQQQTASTSSDDQTSTNPTGFDANFEEEDGTQFKMGVEQEVSFNLGDQESLCYSEDDNLSDSDEDNESTSSAQTKSRSASESPVRKRVTPNKTPPRKIDSPSTNRQKIKELDQEMKTKMIDLHRMMQEGGLTNTAHFMEEHFGVGESASNKKKTKIPPRGRTIQPNYFGTVTAVNKNNNRKSRSIDKAILLQRSTTSDKTIYRNAIEKHNSSSSEECI